MTRCSYWYQDICPCDPDHLWNWPLSVAFVFHKHMLFLLYRSTVSYIYNDNCLIPYQYVLICNKSKLLLLLFKDFCPVYNIKHQRILEQFDCTSLIPDCPRRQYNSRSILECKLTRCFPEELYM